MNTSEIFTPTSIASRIVLAGILAALFTGVQALAGDRIRTPDAAGSTFHGAAAEAAPVLDGAEESVETLSA